jgi:hypothetical protein
MATAQIAQPEIAKRNEFTAFLLARSETFEAAWKAAYTPGRPWNRQSLPQTSGRGSSAGPRGVEVGRMGYLVLSVML